MCTVSSWPGVASDKPSGAGLVEAEQAQSPRMLLSCRVSCHTHYACPSPLLLADRQPDSPCSGHGTCAAPTAAFLTTARSNSGNSSTIVVAPGAGSAASAAAGNDTQVRPPPGLTHTMCSLCKSATPAEAILKKGCW